MPKYHHARFAEALLEGKGGDVAVAQVHATLAVAQQVEALVLYLAYPQRILGIPEPVDAQMYEELGNVVRKMENTEPMIASWPQVIADIKRVRSMYFATDEGCPSTYMSRDAGLQHCTKPLSHVAKGEPHESGGYGWDLTREDRMGP